MAPKFVSATYHLDIKTAEFVADNGDHLLRTGGNPAWRFNNPGNMRPPGKRVITTHIGRATMRDGKQFLIFPDYATGRAELKRLLRDPDSYAQRTLAQAIPKFAPQSDHNDPDRYIRSVSERTGVAADTRLGTLTDAQLEQVMDSIETFEGYHGNATTRSEKWVKAARVSLTDGARPIPNQPVIVRQNGKESKLTTNATGALPAIPYTGGTIDVLMANTRDEWQKVTSIGLPDGSKSFLLVRDLFVAHGATAPHVPRGEVTAAKRAPFEYRIEPHDTLSKIATRFKTSVAKLKEDNKLHSDLIIVGKTLMIYGGASGAAAPHAANSSGSGGRVGHLPRLPVQPSRHPYRRRLRRAQPCTLECLRLHLTPSPQRQRSQPQRPRRLQCLPLPQWRLRARPRLPRLAQFLYRHPHPAQRLSAHPPRARVHRPFKRALRKV